MLRGHLSTCRQMVFLSGPRQVGKASTPRAVAQALGEQYFSWDRQTDRTTILAALDAVAEQMQLHRLLAASPVCGLDELHRYGKWKGFLLVAKDHIAGHPEHGHVL